MDGSKVVLDIGYGGSAGKTVPAAHGFPESRQNARVCTVPGVFPENVGSMELSLFRCPEAAMLVQGFVDANIDPAKKVTASCGLGVAASMVGLALYLTDAPEVATHDGSWTEWGGRADTPIVTGAS